jgi:hypothetical protein
VIVGEVKGVFFHPYIYEKKIYVLICIRSTNNNNYCSGDKVINVSGNLYIFVYNKVNLSILTFQRKLGSLSSTFD